MGTRFRFGAMALLCLSMAGGTGETAAAAAKMKGVAAAGDKVQGTFTVNGKTRLFKFVYVSRGANPEEPGSHYVIVLVSDVEVPDGARAAASALADLAKRGQLHAVRMMWKEGTDGLTATPFDANVEENGQRTTGGAMIDLRAYDERRLSAQISSRPIGQTWHFNATLDATVVPVTLSAAEFGAAVPVVPPVDVERDTRQVDVEAGGKAGTGGDATAMKRTLGRLGFAYTEEGFLQAVNEGSIEAVQLFLRLGMSPNTASDDMPVLMSAATRCADEPIGARVAIVKALLAAHATVDIKDENGSTPLLWSVNVGCHIDIVRALIAAGANVNVKAKGGGTPLMLAQALNRSEIVAVLKAAGAKP